METPETIMSRMIAAPSINPPVSPDFKGSSPGGNAGVAVGVGSGVVCKAPTCLGRLNPVRRMNAVRIPISMSCRVLFDKDIIQGFSLNIRGIIPKSTFTQ
jgi:hypothetical protein